MYTQAQIQKQFSEWLFSNDNRLYKDGYNFPPNVFRISDDLYILRRGVFTFFMYKDVIYPEADFFNKLCDIVDITSEVCSIRIGGSALHFLWIGVTNHYKDVDFMSHILNGEYLFVYFDTTFDFFPLFVYRIEEDRSITAIRYKDMEE